MFEYVEQSQIVPGLAITRFHFPHVRINDRISIKIKKFNEHAQGSCKLNSHHHQKFIIENNFPYNHTYTLYHFLH